MSILNNNRLSWDGFDQLTEKIYAQIKERGIIFDAIIGIARGGMFLSSYLSYKLKIKKLYVSQTMVDQLSQGRMAIVKLEGKYEVVPAALLPKIRERQAECVVAYNEAKPRGATDPDDPYAAFPIPDDYEW